MDSATDPIDTLPQEEQVGARILQRVLANPTTPGHLLASISWSLAVAIQENPPYKKGFNLQALRRCTFEKGTWEHQVKQDMHLTGRTRVFLMNNWLTDKASKWRERLVLDDSSGMTRPLGLVGPGNYPCALCAVCKGPNSATRGCVMTQVGQIINHVGRPGCNNAHVRALELRKRRRTSGPPAARAGAAAAARAGAAANPAAAAAAGTAAIAHIEKCARKDQAWRSRLRAVKNKITKRNPQLDIFEEMAMDTPLDDLSAAQKEKVQKLYKKKKWQK